MTTLNMLENPNQAYLWCVSAIALLVAANTGFRLFMERYRIPREDLTDDDRSLIWRTVVFLVFPLFTLAELKATTAGIEQFGGHVDTWTYGVLWYSLVPGENLADHLVIPAIFSGEMMVIILALLILPALFFKPHPFLATLIGYTSSFVIGVALILEPLLAAAGLPSSKWHLAASRGDSEQLLPLFAIHAGLAIVYVLVVRNQHLRVWFSELSRPEASDRLKEAIFEYKTSPMSDRVLCKLGLLYDRAGLKKQANVQLKLLCHRSQESIYTHFLKAMLFYRHRRYEKARAEFELTASFPGVTGKLKADLLAASACSAFACGDTLESISKAERALAIDDTCLIARMVKIDSLLRLGRKEQAGHEIVMAMHTGPTLDLENKIPLDLIETFDALEGISQEKPVDELVTAV